MLSRKFLEHVRRTNACILARTVFLVSFLCALPFVVGGCAAVSQTVPFSESELKAYESTGTASIRGHSFVRLRNGAKRGGAGIQIHLVPLTAYTEERAKIMESSRNPAPADSRLDKYTKTTTGDWGGAFKFDALPEGDYLVYCRIEWQGPQGGGDYYGVARTHLARGEQKDVVVTNPDQK